MKRARRSRAVKEPPNADGFVTVSEFAARFRIGRSTVYDAIAAGRLKAITIFSSKRIPTVEVTRVEREGL